MHEDLVLAPGGRSGPTDYLTFFIFLLGLVRVQTESKSAECVSKELQKFAALCKVYKERSKYKYWFDAGSEKRSGSAD